ncbi:hypothetical protein M3Y98_01123400 [Aphelenchoides besseyi]|nr:hypothetical protein M3Y98_01123400 [Aphelenchoides besseyi]KAI6210513.1 hypothetical protein M3Y96_00336300 [Aphelenchoides besseyi]
MDLSKGEWHGSEEELTKLNSEGKIVFPEDWNAVISVVKDLYLKMGIHAVSHRSLKFLVELAAAGCSGKKMAFSLAKSWYYAVQFYQYSYGSTNFKPTEFGLRKAAVESFVRDFASIDQSAVSGEAMKLVNCSSENIALKSEAGKTSLGKQTYSFKYTAY